MLCAQYRARLKVPLVQLFWIVRLSFEKKLMSPKGPPFDFNEAPLVFSGIKRYIRTFDHIYELYSVLVRKRRMFENRSLPWKRPTHFSKNVLL